MRHEKTRRARPNFVKCVQVEYEHPEGVFVDTWQLDHLHAPFCSLPEIMSVKHRAEDLVLRCDKFDYHYICKSHSHVLDVLDMRMQLAHIYPVRIKSIRWGLWDTNSTTRMLAPRNSFQFMIQNKTTKYQPPPTPILSTANPRRK